MLARTWLASSLKGSRSRTKSPLLLPVPEDNLQGTDLDDVFSLDTNYRPFSDEPRSFDSEGDSSDEEGVTDFTSESVHVEGVPRSHQRFDAKCAHSLRPPLNLAKMPRRRYSTPAFSRQLLTMLIDDIALPGWVELSVDEDVGRMTIFKVSGALTNAVFFVSCPKDEGVSPPTVLVRVYGPSSDSLLSVRSMFSCRKVTADALTAAARASRPAHPLLRIQLRSSRPWHLRKRSSRGIFRQQSARQESDARPEDQLLDSKEDEGDA